MDQLLEIGKKHNLAVIEDSAEAIGSIYKGRRAGSMGCFGAFLFMALKRLPLEKEACLLQMMLNFFHGLLPQQSWS